jgi:hypothetical protein
MPEDLGGSMWKILPGESVTGRTSDGTRTIVGPQIVRVELFSRNLMRVQVGQWQIEVDGLNFENAVKRTQTEG